MNPGSMDNERVRVVNVNQETVLALLFFPSGHVDIKSQVPRDQAVAMLRATADVMEADQ
ncbi:DUF7433 family protein [Mycolicibacterium komossense]|uniref:Uncharacterized protein n=1 Tax=Mycolicibacterium komossense TaxID=1779 RepID=A0ABT3C9I5_9MYCO|nr:hypothetical protein [Mycolicibacterium komossense]MCV7226098.1 hypothetical protein [Mycolicibacterium komossense]